MRQNITTSNAAKQGNRPQKQLYRNQKNYANENIKKTNEFNSYYGSLEYSNYYFGLNILEMYSPEQLAALVKDPIANNKTLRDISLMLYGTNGTYTNVVDYMTSLPSLSKVIIPHGKSENKKRKNKALMLTVLRAIKDKEFVRDALFKGMVEGVAFYYFETQGMPLDNKKYLTDYDVYNVLEINELGVNASIIPLPVDFTQIVGLKNNNYVLAFNLDYFDLCPNEPVERKLKKYPKEIRDAYYKRHDQQQNDDFGNWVILDSTKTIVHKIRSKAEEKYGRPLVLAAIMDILYRDYFTDTKRNVLDEINNRIVYQTFPEGKDKGTSALTKSQQESQHNAVKAAVLGKNNRGGISFFSIAAGTKINALDAANIDIFDEKNEGNLDDKIALALGFAGNALSGTGSGSYSAQESNLELVTSQVYQWIGQIQNELNKCINANIIKDTRNWVDVEYLPITHLNKKSMVENAKELYLEGCGSLSLWIASCGISPEAYFALLDEEKENGIYEKYKPHQTSYTLSNKSSLNKGGRPEADNPTDSTIISRSNNGNSNPSPSDNK